MSTAALIAGQQPQIRQIPLWLKLVYTAFLAVLVPVYWNSYGPLNFLWFCDVALLMTLLAVWSEMPLLASMPAVGIVFPQLIWVVDFLIGLCGGGSPLGMSGYMFNAESSLFARGLSTFHGWLPFLLIYLVVRLGYDRRAMWAETLLCWAVLIVSFLLVPHEDPADGGNVNKIFGPTDGSPQQWMPPVAWLILLMVAYPVLIYVPSHLVFRRLSKPAMEGSMPELEAAP